MIVSFDMVIVEDEKKIKRKHQSISINPVYKCNPYTLDSRYVSHKVPNEFVQPNVNSCTNVRFSERSSNKTSFRLIFELQHLTVKQRKMKQSRGKEQTVFGW